MTADEAMQRLAALATGDRAPPDRDLAAGGRSARRCAPSFAGAPRIRSGQPPPEPATYAAIQPQIGAGGIRHLPVHRRAHGVLMLKPFRPAPHVSKGIRHPKPWRAGDPGF